MLKYIGVYFWLMDTSTDFGGRQAAGDYGCSDRGSFLLLSFICLFVGASAIETEASAASGPHGTIELVAEQSSVRPGRGFWVGLHFKLEKGWHVYWMNPGDSGESPRVQWNLPSGFRVGPLQWPVPRRIEDHSLIDYGYEDEVLLPVEIDPPASFSAERDVSLKATVHWLVCREVCLPGRAALDLALPVGGEKPAQQSVRQGLFAEARARLPKPTPKQWKLTGYVEGRQFVLEAETGRQQAKATFFPFEPNLVENAAPQNASPLSRGVRLRLQKSDQLVTPALTLAGVLVLGPEQAYVVNVPVRTGAK